MTVVKSMIVRLCLVVMMVFIAGKICWGSLVDSGAVLPAGAYSSLAWGDYDNDGDLDLAFSGLTSSGPVSTIYRNDNGVFVNINAGLVGVSKGDITWGDYDKDGDLDLALTGVVSINPGTCVSKVYRNDGGRFVDINASLDGVYTSSLAWGDYDNDGDLDLALNGFYMYAVNNSTFPYRGNSVSKIYRNDQPGFTDINVGLPGVNYSTLGWADYDNDGDLDLALSGSFITKIYRNDLHGYVNIPPLAPTSGFAFSYSSATQRTELRWGYGSDDKTPSQGLYYAVRMSNKWPNDNNSRTVSWWPATPFLGSNAHGFIRNGQPGLILNRLAANTTYYWQVRSVDTGLQAGRWSSVRSFYIGGAAPATFPTTATGNLAQFVVYPNPYKPNSGLGHNQITFAGLTGKAKIEIFTLTGVRVREMDKDDSNDNFRWDAHNDDGNSLASGVYYYVISGENSEKKIGKIAIVK